MNESDSMRTAGLKAQIVAAVAMQSPVLSQNSSGLEIDVGVKIAFWAAVS